MKYSRIFLLLNLFLALLSVTGCRRNSNDVWEDTKTAGRHVKRGMGSLGGKHGNSRQVNSRDDFYIDENGACVAIPQNHQNEFVPLQDNPNNEVAMGEFVSRPPRQTPGDPGSSIPGIDAFRDPVTVSHLAPIFKNLSFEYNSYLVRGQANLEVIRDAADYMKQHPNTYVFVEGHCDERGPEAFNLSLGANRSNAVRNLLIGEGVNPDNVFTISYGKERPLILGHTESVWSQNRRVEFKVYER